jgi:FAD/FMN-containing dehydrogenase
MQKRRSILLSIVLLAASFLVLGARKVYEYAVAPEQDKDSDFVFPTESAPEKTTTIVFDPKLAAFTFRQVGGFTDDASHLNKTPIYGIVEITSENDIRNALRYAREHKLKVTCAGQQHSMGGQTFSAGGLVLDLRGFNQIRLDRARHVVNVQSGVRWWQLQQFLDKEGLAVKAMQSINIFSIGGSLSVNGHGIDPTPGQIAPTVRSVRVMLSDGKVVEASPAENADLFKHILGGYGLFGVILDADLDIVDNEIYERRAVYMDYKDYPEFYRKNVENNENVGLVFGRLSISPGSYLRETAAHVYLRSQSHTELPPLTPERYEGLDRFIINFSKRGAIGRWLRWTLEKHIEPRLHSCLTRNQAMSQKDICLVSRNEEMYDDMAYLKNRLRDTDILQEYFIPYDRMPEFVDRLRNVVKKNEANLLNVTIRTVHKDNITALPYAKEDMFGFVLYFNVGFDDEDNEILKKTTIDLIEAAEQSGGTYYLPYQLFYSKQQLERAYPEIEGFFAAKQEYDPIELFSNKFYEKYSEPSS